MFPGLFEIGFLSAAVAFNGEACLGCAQTQHILDVVWVQCGFTAAEVPTHQLHGQPAEQHDSRSFGVAPDVVLGSGSYIAFTTWRSAHDHAAADFGSDAGI